MSEQPSPHYARSRLWKQGHRLELLENGEAYFPRVNQAIKSAGQRVVIETFILFEDEIGLELARVLIDASYRGVKVDITVDGYGSSSMTPDFIAALTDAGVRLHIYDPRPTLFGMRTNLFRRLHRKIVVVDGRIAFIGGINFAVDHVRSYGPEAKQDYAVMVEGPVVDDLSALAEAFLDPIHRPRRLLHAWWRRKPLPPPQSGLPPVGNAAAALLVRDNDQHRDDIERHYRAVLRAARTRVIIANAYFIPGYRLLRDIRKAAHRGVKVHLILQGRPDKWLTRWAAQILYDWLLDGGVRIHEYCERPLHGKVAVVDHEWSTVGSSNLDPLSLSLNLEANLMILDPEFNALLGARLEHLISCSCREVIPPSTPLRPRGRQFITFVLFHFLRWYPAFGGWLPAHQGKVRWLSPEGPRSHEQDDEPAPAERQTARET